MASSSTGEVQPTLVFIPDISGFTRFVNETEIAHSQHIIEELLEVLIDTNEIGLTVSEIEGDAILFYREGPAPTAAEILAQVQRMYVAFHAHLKKYDTYRICHCGACCSAIDLTLKFVSHFGDLGTKRVKEHAKLFGRDVIIAHRLLKNEIQDDEYVLLTEPLVQACATWVHVEESAWAEVEHGEETYDFGSIGYCHLSLAPLREHVPAPPPGDFGLKGPKTRVMEFEWVISASLETVFNVLSDVSRRHEWIVGVQDSTELNSRITRDGSTHRCLMKGTEGDPFYISHSFSVEDDLVSFVDSDPNVQTDAVYHLHRIGPRLTRVHRTDFMAQRLFRVLFFRTFIQRTLSSLIEASGANLQRYCEGLEESGHSHPAQILLRPAAT